MLTVLEWMVVSINFTKPQNIMHTENQKVHLNFKNVFIHQSAAFSISTTVRMIKW